MALLILPSSLILPQEFRLFFLALDKSRKTKPKLFSGIETGLGDLMSLRQDVLYRKYCWARISLRINCANLKVYKANIRKVAIAPHIITTF